MTAPPLLSIFARWPEPGRAKTRLIPALGAEGAARLYERLLRSTLDEARRSGLAFEVRVAGCAPAAFRERFGADLAVVAQGEGDLGARMARVRAPALVIGSDCPDCDAGLLVRAAGLLREHDAVLGPAADGGYYLIGLARPMGFLFTDMAWSTAGVLPETLRRMRARRVEPAMLPELHDLDDPADLARFPGFAR